MTDNKLTDEQIIKDLERATLILSRDILIDNDVTIGDVLDLINRLKAQLEDSQDAHIRTAVDKDVEIDKLKAEIERLKPKCEHCGRDKPYQKEGE